MHPQFKAAKNIMNHEPPPSILLPNFYSLMAGHSLLQDRQKVQPTTQISSTIKPNPTAKDAGSNKTHLIIIIIIIILSSHPLTNTVTQFPNGHIQKKTPPSTPPS